VSLARASGDLIRSLASERTIRERKRASRRVLVGNEDIILKIIK